MKYPEGLLDWMRQNKKLYEDEIVRLHNSVEQLKAVYKQAFGVPHELPSVADLQDLLRAAAERIAGQSELLSKKAEKQ